MRRSQFGQHDCSHGRPRRRKRQLDLIDHRASRLKLNTQPVHRRRHCRTDDPKVLPTTRPNSGGRHAA